MDHFLKDFRGWGSVRVGKGERKRVNFINDTSSTISATALVCSKYGFSFFFSACVSATFAAKVFIGPVDFTTYTKSINRH